MNGFHFVSGRWRSPAALQWAPTLTAHDPNPPLTLEDPAGGGGSVSLAGVSHGTASAAGALTLSQSLAGASAGSGSAGASLTIEQSLAGVAGGAGSASGALTVGQSLAGVSPGASTAAGSLSISQSLAGASPGTSSGSGNLTVDVPSGDVALSGASAGSGEAAAVLTIEGGEEPQPPPVTVVYSGAPRFYGRPKTMPVSLAGRADGMSGNHARLSVAIAIQGRAVGSGFAGATLQIDVALTGRTARPKRSERPCGTLYVREEIDPAVLAFIAMRKTR